MATGYLRYSCDGAKLGSYGNNFASIRHEFQEMLNPETSSQIKYNSYLSNRNPGDLVKVEIFKRTSREGRLPKATVHLRILSVLETDRGKRVSVRAESLEFGVNFDPSK